MQRGGQRANEQPLGGPSAASKGRRPGPRRATQGGRKPVRPSLGRNLAMLLCRRNLRFLCSVPRFPRNRFGAFWFSSRKSVLRERSNGTAVRRRKSSGNLLDTRSASVLAASLSPSLCHDRRAAALQRSYPRCLPRASQLTHTHTPARAARQRACRSQHDCTLTRRPGLCSVDPTMG